LKLNFSTLIGFMICVGVLFLALTETEGAKTILLNRHAITIVLGGTLAATFISFPIKRVFSLSWVAFKKLMGVSFIDYSAIIQEVIAIAEAADRDPAVIKTVANTVQHPFLKEGIQLLADGATEEQLSYIMGTRIETFRRRHAAESGMFRTIGKFPPAFGLLGTTLGMITLLNQLGGPDAQKLVGPAMAIGLVATLYGIGFTNFILIPIAENLSTLSSEDYASRKMVLEGLLMIKRKVHPILVEEQMKSFLLPSERAKLGGRVAAQPAPGRSKVAAKVT
jgi:chemotaxis protein MotA